MSLITLTSSQNASDPRPTDPALIKNTFKDGITIRKGSEVGLVNLTINKQPLFEVPAGISNQLVWRIGRRTQYNQHTSVIPAGNYTGNGLANQIQQALNTSTIIGVYKGNWTCVFDPTANADKGGFTINYGASDTPIEGGNTFTTYNGLLDIVNAVNDTTITSVNSNGTPFQGDTPQNIATANRGIFANGGKIEYVAKPFQIQSKGNFATAFIGTQFQEVLGGLATATFDIVASQPAVLANGYAFTLTNWSDARADAYLAYPFSYGNGSFWYSLDHTLPPAQQTQMFFSPNANGVNDGALQNNVEGGRGASNGLGLQFRYQAGGLNPARDLGFLGKQYAGYCRNDLYLGKINYPANANAHINTELGGTDIWFELCQSGADGDEVSVSLNQLIQTQGTSFPNANWRNNSAYVFEDLDPNADFTSRTGASNWAMYTTEDHIKMTIEIEGITKIICKISHDTAGDGNFTEEQTLATSGTQGFISRIHENHFPLRPCVAMTDGGYYNDQEVVGDTIGIYDDAENTGNLQWSGNDPTDENPELGADPADLKLSALYKTGLITPDRIGTDPDQITQEDYNGAQGNVAILLGLEPFYVFPQGNSTNPISSSVAPNTNIAEPSLLLELFDFNIEGHNGKTGDKSKLIAVIPKEELFTGEDAGVLHYNPQFPVFIDLNLPEDKTYYDLNVVLRTRDGTIANDLINPTEMTLMIKESEESRMRRLMKEQAESIALAIANRNETKINQIGVNMPRI
jgi:hypothetical protein